MSRSNNAATEEEIHQRRSTSVGTGTGIGTATTSENEDDYPYLGFWNGEGERERERDRGVRRALLTAGRDGVEGGYGDGEVEIGVRGRERRKAGGRGRRVVEGGRRQWMADLKAGKLGDLLRSPACWRVYVGGLVVWLGGCQFGLLLMNRFILWSK